MKFSHDWMSDTHPDALRAYLEIQSRISPERKLAMVAEMYAAGRSMLRTCVDGRRHWEW
jgi:hypothetical protein